MTGNFTDSGQKSDPILIRVRESIRFALAGTWVGTVVLERSESGVDGWKKIRVIQSNIDTSTRNLEDKKYYLRLRTLRFTSGVANYTLEDVVGDKIWAEVLPDGTEIISVTDDGNLYVRGELFSGGGGGGTPGGSANSIQYNNAGAFGGFGSWDGSEFILPGLLALQESGGSGLVKLKCADFTTDYTITFPDTAPTTDGQTLVYDGVGTYFWEVPSVPVFTGDSGSGGTSGSVPAPAIGDATKFLKGDATWATVSASPGGATTEIQYNDAGSFEGWNKFVIADHYYHGAGTLSTQWINDINSTPGIEIGKGVWTYTNGSRTAQFFRGDANTTTDFVEVAADSTSKRFRFFYLGDMYWHYQQSLLNNDGFKSSIATVSGEHRFDLFIRGTNHSRVGQTDLIYNNNGGSDVILWSFGTDGMLLSRQTGKTLSFKTGTGQAAGTATLVAGTVTVTNANITANSIIIINRKTAGGTIGDLTYTLSAGASFTVNSASGSDTSTVSYLVVETHT